MKKVVSKKGDFKCDIIIDCEANNEYVDLIGEATSDAGQQGYPAKTYSRKLIAQLKRSDIIMILEI